MADTTSMHAASREALAAAEHRLEGVLGDAGASPATVGEELYSFARMLGSEVSLRRALADASASEDARKGLVRGLVEGKVSEQALQVLDTVVTSRWSNPRELYDGVRLLAANALFIGAERDGRLDTVEGELFTVARLIADTPELERAFSEQTAPEEAKRELARRVFGGKVESITQTLIEQGALHSRGRGVHKGFETLSELAAQRRQRSVAHVMTASPLTDEQRATLSEKLDRIYGRHIALHVEVRPGVVGGMVVKVGDEVIDGSSSGRITALRGQLA